MSRRSRRTKDDGPGVPTLTPVKLFKSLVKSILNGHQFLIVGAPGVGKTDIVTQAVEFIRTWIQPCNLIILHPVVSDPTDFKGYPAIVNGKATFLAFTELEAMVKADVLTVVFFDDLGQASPTVQAAAMQLILGRAINGHKISDHVVFVAASNRKEDFGAVSGILEPVKSRWTSIIQLVVDAVQWLSWAEGDGQFKMDGQYLVDWWTKRQAEIAASNGTVNKYVRAFIERRPTLLHDFQPSQDMINTPSPRTVVNAAKIMDGDYDKDCRRSLLAGAVGQGWTDDFLAFLDIIDRMVNPNLVIQAPEKVDVPGDHDVLFVLCQALAERATDKNFNNIMVFCTRIEDREFQKLLVSTATKRDESLKNTTGYITWAAANPELHS
jgi:hypothetical protein